MYISKHLNNIYMIILYIYREAKQQQRLQNGGTLSKGKRSTTKVGPKTSNNRNEMNPIRSRSRSRSRPKSKLRHWQTDTQRASSRNWNKQNRTESAVINNRGSRPSEIIHALKEINGVKENEAVEDYIAKSNNDVFNNKESDIGLQALSNRDASVEMLQNGKTHFIKNKHFDEPNQSFDRSFGKLISTQTDESNDSMEILKFIQVAMQSSLSCNNVVETGCNTIHYNAICKDAGISCDLIDLTNSKGDVDSTAMIEDKTPTLENVPFHAKFITHTESNAKDEYSDKSKKPSMSECQQTSSTEMTLKLEDYDIMEMEIPVKTTSNFIKDEEKMDENFHTVFKNSHDKINIDIDTQAFTKYSSDSVDNLFLERPRPSSSIYEYDASCSSEELAEYLENDVQHGNIVMPELKVENIPNDLIAAFELAAERARNLQKAIIIYYENLIPGGTEKPNEGTTEDYETVEKCVCFVNYEIENRKRSERDSKSCRFHVTNGEDIDRFSTCSTRSSNSVQICKPAIHKFSLTDYCEFVNQKEIKSSELVIDSIREEKYALEVLQSKEDENDSGDFEAAESIKTLALLMTVEKTSPTLLRENLLALVYCILCSIIFWYLQVSF